MSVSFPSNDDILCRFGKHVDSVVPFLPLGKEQMREIIDLKLQEMSEEHRYVVEGIGRWID